MSLALHYWMGDVHHCSRVPVSEMTYTVSSGTLNSTIPYHTNNNRLEHWPTAPVISSYSWSCLSDCSGLVSDGQSMSSTFSWAAQQHPKLSNRRDLERMKLDACSLVVQWSREHLSTVCVSICALCSGALQGLLEPEIVSATQQTTFNPFTQILHWLVDSNLCRIFRCKQRDCTANIHLYSHNR